MNESVKSTEIKSVLSSIKRLVSERQTEAPSPEDDAPDASPERLVLTEALRVPEPEADVEDDLFFRTEMIVVDSLLQGTMSCDLGDPADADDAVQEDHETAPVVPAEPSRDEPYPAAVSTKDYAADVAEDEQPTATGSGQEDGAQTDTTDIAPETPWQNPETTLYQAAAFSSVRRGGGSDTPPEDTRPLGEKIAALEKVIGRSDDQGAADDTAGASDLGPTADTQNVGDTDETSAKTRPAGDSQPDTSDMVEAKEAEEVISSETTLDEETLKTLVAEIVREELQGALGERITRSVRKLVRSEIQRALTVKDVE